jgi:hypothetical protein
LIASQSFNSSSLVRLTRGDARYAQQLANREMLFRRQSYTGKRHKTGGALLFCHFQRFRSRPMILQRFRLFATLVQKHSPNRLTDVYREIRGWLCACLPFGDVPFPARNFHRILAHAHAGGQRVPDSAKRHCFFFPPNRPWRSPTALSPFDPPSLFNSPEAMLFNSLEAMLFMSGLKTGFDAVP